MQGDALARLLSASTIDEVLQALLDAGAPTRAYRAVAGGLANDVAHLGDARALAAADVTLAFARGAVPLDDMVTAHLRVLGVGKDPASASASGFAQRAAFASSSPHLEGHSLTRAVAAIAEAALLASGRSSAASARLHQADVARATLTPSLLHDEGGIHV